MDIEEARKIAKRLMTEHGLISLGWSFDFDHAKRRFGCCNYGRKRISVSWRLVMLNEVPRVTNTLLHEIAHALTSRGAGHGWEWKQKCKEIGCDAERCYNSEVVNVVHGKYIMQCPKCKRKVHFFKRKKRESACGICCKKHNNGRFHQAFVLVDYKGDDDNADTSI